MFTFSIGRRCINGWLNAVRIAVAMTALTLSQLAAAAFPTGPIKIVVPYPPSGATDTIGRQIAIELAKVVGQPVVVDNRPGAAGNIGVASVANAAADGYTLVVAASSHVAADPVLEKLPFDPRRDLAAVAPLVSIPYVVVANPTFAPNNIGELIAAAKKEPGKINFASSGIGGPPHLASELILAMGNVQIKHIPYKGAVPAYTDLVGGQVQFMTGDVNTAMPFLQGNRLKAIATTGRERLELLPDVPTVAESGLPGYEAEGWFGIFAPAKTPPDVLAYLAKAVEKAAAQADFKKRMATLGGKVMKMESSEFERYIASETTKRANLIKSNNIQIGN